MAKKEETISLIDTFSEFKEDLHVWIRQILICYNFTVTPYFEISFVRIHNNVVIFISAKHFRDHTTERFFENAYHSCSINIL